MIRRPTHRGDRSAARAFRSSASYSGIDRFDGGHRALDFNDQCSVVLVVQVDLDGPLRVVHVHEQPLTAVEAACHHNSGQRCAQQAQTPRFVQGIRVSGCAAHVFDRDFDAASERKYLVEALDLDSEVTR